MDSKIKRLTILAMLGIMVLVADVYKRQHVTSGDYQKYYAEMYQ